MNKLKQGLSILTLTMLLLAVAAAPILLMSYKNERMINQITVSVLSDDEEAVPELQNYDVRERLKVIEESTGVVEQQQDAIPEEKREEVLRKFKEQLSVLTKLGAVPPFDFTGEQQSSVSKRTYMSTQNSGRFVSILLVNVEYAGYRISGFMDAQTSLIYGFTIVANENQLVYDPNVISEEGFLEYLQIDSEEIDEHGDSICTASYYADEIFSLFAAKYNKDTHLIERYHFGFNGGERAREYTTVKDKNATLEIEPVQ